jgi:uncharacterized protein (UPF0264 family)
MTRLLVSVRSREEARIAVAGGVDIVDVKEPRRGSLGAADADTLRAVCAEIAGRLPLSAALGELQDFTSAGAAGCHPSLLESLEGFQYAKFGLAGCASDDDWRLRWREALARLPAGVSPIAVAYADWHACDAPPPEDVLQTGLELGCAGLLIDTFDKRPGDLFHWQPHKRLAELVDGAHAARRLAALAGSLTLKSIPRAIQAGADVIAVRGAVCAKRRWSSIDPRRLRNVSRCVKHRLLRAK